MNIARIVLDIPTQALDEAYTYAVPEGMDDLAVGCAVVVPFGGRRAVGFVMEVREPDEREARLFAGDQLTLSGIPSKMKPVERVVSKSFFDADGAACAVFLAERYLAPLSSCVRLFTPPGGVPRMVRGRNGWRLEEPATKEVDVRWVRLAPGAASFTPRKSAVKQIAILQALAAGELRVSDLTAEYGAVSSTLNSLVKHGAIEIFERRSLRGTPQGAEYAATALAPAARPQLTCGQQEAVAAIDAAYRAHAGACVVVDGVTGSGKTEVYLRAIETCVREGRSAIVLVPEISLTPQTVARFRGRFGDMVAVLHSRMSAGERFDQWDLIRSGTARVVVGARSALFAPVRDLGLVVIDEEHEGSYKQDQAPRYVARDVATWMVARRGAALVLGSATPSIETLYRARHDPSCTLVRLPQRANGKPMPQITVVDMAREFSNGSRRMFSRTLSEALHETLRARHKAVLMLNQRGFASFVLCRACGFVPTCPNCSTSLTYHEQGNWLVCHHCGYRRHTPPVCPECGSPYLKRFGAGTQRVEAELVGLIAEFGDVAAEVVRMDADTTSRKGAHEALLEKFGSAETAVLLGTQMIAKGLDFDDVTLVGVINADTQLRLPDFRSGERTFDLIEQVAGRAGRADLPGRVIVQTYSADAVPIRAAARYDREAFLANELEKRKALGYPPYVRLADVLVWGKREDQVQEEARSVYAALRARLAEAGSQGWLMLPPVPCVLSRLRGYFRYHITIKAPLEADIGGVLAPVFRSRKAHPYVNVAVDVDPQSLL